MKEEFLDLYNKWHSSYIFSAFGSSDPRAKRYYDALIEWCKNHHDETLQYVRELLLEEPSDVVRVLDDLYTKEYNFEVKGYCPLDVYCNFWLNITTPGFEKGGIMVDYYKGYNEYKDYMKKNYISWRPNLEDDPNVTIEEYIQGKRNNKNIKRKWHEFPLSILKDEELETLYNEGHIGDMTKYIAELHHFYNQVEEEIKCRKLKKNESKSK